MYSVVLCACKDEKGAKKIAMALLKGRLAACVSIIPKVKSLYRWKGNIVKEGESMMIIKTKKPLAGRLMNRIKELHSYDVPEITELSVVRGNTDYLDWLIEATK